MTITPPPPAGNSHLAWVDALRIFACFLVVVAHCCDPVIGGFGDGFSSGVFWGSLVRPCVPLFAMISGVLLFPVTTDMGTFYSRRLKRILIPLVVWSLVLPLLYFGYFALGVHTTNPNIVMETYTWTATVQKFYLFLFNFGYDTIPLWYLYMLAGLYLFMPIIGGWLKTAGKKDVKLFLILWVASLLVPYLEIAAPFLGYQGNYGSMGVLGDCFWNPFGMFYYFAGFMGYLVLAHYLVKYPLNWSWAKTIAIAIPLFLAGYAGTVWGFFEMQDNFAGQYAYLEIPWYFCSINVAMMTFAVFSIFCKLKVKGSPMLSRVAALTFGIYLCHFFFVQCSYDLLDFLGLDLPGYVKIPVLACMAFAISLVVAWLLNLNKWTRKSIM